jgi:DNA helicase-2/ATP-dependent DNA helicase PcrA
MRLTNALYEVHLANWRTVKQGVFELYKVKNETSEAQWVVNKIQEIVSLKNRDDIEGELNFEKIVVLARNKYLFKSLDR